MRTIKFRSWYADRKVMTEGYTLEHLLKTANNHDKRSYDESMAFTEIMQFTGLLDKNGKEIYEGDVVRGDWSVNKIVEVKTRTLAYGFVPFNDDYFFTGNDVEVIGNIYESPELITN